MVFVLLVLFAKPPFLWIISSSHSFGMAEQTAVIRGASQPTLLLEVVSGCAGSLTQTRSIKKSPMQDLRVPRVTEEKGFFQTSRLAQGAVEQEGGRLRWEVHPRTHG